MKIVPQDATRTTGDRWGYIKALKPTDPRFFHISVQYLKKSKTNEETGVVTNYLEATKPVTYRKPKVEVIREN